MKGNRTIEAVNRLRKDRMQRGISVSVVLVVVDRVMDRVRITDIKLKDFKTAGLLSIVESNFVLL